MSMEIDEYLIDTVAMAEFQPNFQERHVADRQQTLGSVFGERTQARAMSSGQEECFHKFTIFMPDGYAAGWGIRASCFCFHCHAEEIISSREECSGFHSRAR